MRPRRNGSAPEYYRALTVDAGPSTVRYSTVQSLNFIWTPNHPAIGPFVIGQRLAARPDP
eukprot:618896-Hanusia_phi.AAC.2